MTKPPRNRSLPEPHHKSPAHKAGGGKPSGKPQGKPGAADPRRLALRLLRDILRERMTFDEAESKHRTELEKLERRDRAFLRLLLTTVLRRLGQLDRVINDCTDRRLSSRMDDVRDILRLGAAQLLFLKTPPHAAVSTSLNLARGPKLIAHKGLINALLRRIAREGDALMEKTDEARGHLPMWLWNRWCETYGEETTRAIASVQLEEPPLDLTVKSDPQVWAEKLGATPLSGNSIRLPAGTGDPSQLEGYTEGAWWVQDFAASLPARLLGDVEDLAVADLCAAPGGKTAELLCVGAEVTAVDISSPRLKRLRENLQRLNLETEVIQADLLSWQPGRQFDAILLDAPCSATGTLRRHPELGRIKTAKDLDALIELQGKLLERAFDLLKPGGTLVYATCSLEPEEGAAQIDRLLEKKGPDLQRVPVRPEEVSPDDRKGTTWGLDLITAEGDLRCLPCHLGETGGMDGFFASRLRKAPED